ncbi:hypothetical protein ACQ4PT_033493 [Festuca glaucescens]
MSRRTLRSTTPRTLALTAVQRQTAASRSTNPCNSGQHSSCAGTPTLRPSRPPRTFVHTLSLSTSMEHCPPPPLYGGGTTTGGWQYGSQPCTATAERRLRVTKSPSLDAIVMLY